MNQQKCLMQFSVLKCTWRHVTQTWNNKDSYRSVLRKQSADWAVKTTWPHWLNHLFGKPWGNGGTNGWERDGEWQVTCGEAVQQQLTFLFITVFRNFSAYQRRTATSKWQPGHLTTTRTLQEETVEPTRRPPHPVEELHPRRAVSTKTWLLVGVRLSEEWCPITVLCSDSETPVRKKAVKSQPRPPSSEAPIAKKVQTAWSCDSYRSDVIILTNSWLFRFSPGKEEWKRSQQGTNDSEDDVSAAGAPKRQGWSIITQYQTWRTRRLH